MNENVINKYRVLFFVYILCELLTPLSPFLIFNTLWVSLSSIEKTQLFVGLIAVAALVGFLFMVLAIKIKKYLDAEVYKEASAMTMKDIIFSFFLDIHAFLPMLIYLYIFVKVKDCTIRFLLIVIVLIVHSIFLFLKYKYKGRTSR
jgi:hypothetical protein